MAKQKKYDRVKEIRRNSRQTTGLYGKAGVHYDKTRREKHKADYMEEEEVDDIRIGLADIVTAFNREAIGSKVLLHSTFMDILEDAIRAHDFTVSDGVIGQAVLTLPEEACRCVSSGVGKRTEEPEDYVARFHREKVGLYLNRKCVDDKPDSVRVVVYTLNAYLNDPDSSWDEIQRVVNEGYTHMLVAVLASQGPPSPLTPHRFVHNLAGGNREALIWTADEIRAKAKEIKDYYNEWTTLAD